MTVAPSSRVLETREVNEGQVEAVAHAELSARHTNAGPVCTQLCILKEKQKVLLLMRNLLFKY